MIKHIFTYYIKSYFNSLYNFGQLNRYISLIIMKLNIDNFINKYRVFNFDSSWLGSAYKVYEIHNSNWFGFQRTQILYTYPHQIGLINLMESFKKRFFVFYPQNETGEEYHLFFYECLDQYFNRNIIKTWVGYYTI